MDTQDGRGARRQSAAQAQSPVAGDPIRQTGGSLHKIVIRYIAAGAIIALLGCWVWSVT